MPLGYKHKAEWFSRFRKPRKPCEWCKQPVKTTVTRFCSVSCSNRWKYSDKSRHPNWRGGATKDYRKLRNSLWKQIADWRAKVLARDGYKCVFCGSTENVQADHIKAFILYPQLRFNINNGRTLCRPCHYKTDNYGSKVYRRKDKAGAS